MIILPGKNVGRFDQILRVGISAVLIYFGLIDDFIADKFSAYLLGIIGVLSLIIALIRICPLYALIGINTCHRPLEN